MESNFQRIKEQAKKAEPQIDGIINLDGIRERVIIIRDIWGIPHIYAKSLADVFFAQGFVHAQDRLWQMEIFRRNASGTLCEIFGTATLDSDIFFRTIGLRRSAEKEANLIEESENDTSRKILDSYVKGVNASIEIQRESLPLEFSLLNYTPSDWTIADSIVMVKMLSWGLSKNWRSELLRYELIEKLGEKHASQLLPFQVTEHSTIVPSLHSMAPNDSGQGSNNWVIDGVKSTTGKPILANDPHLQSMTPSIWYENHLVCPGLMVIGASMASIPGVIIGHNEDIAWGFTNSGPDVQDLYIELFNPDDDTEVLYNEKWEKIEVITEKFNVRGGEAVEKQIRITRHGPIIDTYPVGMKTPKYCKIQRDENFSLRWIGHDFMADQANAILKMNQAKNWEEFKAGLKHWIAPSQNVVYADVEGNIGYYMPGKVPIRKNGHGLLPVPGWTSEHEWEGFIPFEELPHSYNPSTHFIATANNKIVSDDYPYHISYDWAPPYRIRRIVQLLTEKNKLSIEDFKRIQGDVTSLRAKEILSILLEVKAKNKRQEKALKLLYDWRYELMADSSPALIYEVWLSKLARNILLEKLGESLYELYKNRAAILNLLRFPSKYWFPGNSESNIENRDKIILKSLNEALDEIESQQGKEMEKWRWGKTHTVTFTHPLSLLPGLSEIFNRGPLERGGDGTTINNTSFDAVAGFEQYHVASYRQIIDLKDLTRSVSTHTLGQSGHPFSKHYDDFLPLWHNGDYHPMLFEKNDIEQNEESRLILTPQ